MPDATQTAIRMGIPGIPLGDARYYPLSVGNQVLGGLFTSRLNANLREDKGWTYGAYSFFTLSRGPAPYIVDTTVEASRTGDAIAEIFSELGKIKAAPITDEEFHKGRQSVLASVATLFPTTATAARTTGQLFQFGLPVTFYDGLPDRLTGLTAATLREQLNQFLDLDAFVIVVVGDRAKIEPQLASLGRGDFVEVNPDGRRLPFPR